MVTSRFNPAISRYLRLCGFSFYHANKWGRKCCNQAITLKTPWQGSTSEIGILRQLECSMANITQPYDELAAHYDRIFEDWEASIARQSTVFAGILDRECGDRRPIRVLDCACGIGTQSLGLAMKGFDVTGCDISIGAVQRARSEASKRGLGIPFLVANMVQLSAQSRSRASTR